MSAEEDRFVLGPWHKLLDWWDRIRHRHRLTDVHMVEHEQWVRRATAVRAAEVRALSFAQRRPRPERPGDRGGRALHRQLELRVALRLARLLG